MSDDDLDIGENETELRQEQWEEIRNNKMSNEAICKAEKLVEELGSEIKRIWKGIDWRRERWGSPTEENDPNGFESLEEKVGRLARRVEELESDRKKGRDSRGGGRCKCDGENWWFRVRPPRTNQFETEAEDFQDDKGDF